MRKKELVALHYCVVAVCVLCLFLMVPWVGLQSLMVSFPDHTHLFLENIAKINKKAQVTWNPFTFYFPFLQVQCIVSLIAGDRRLSIVKSQ